MSNVNISISDICNNATAEAVDERWYGHGEGGLVTHIKIRLPIELDTYNTPTREKELLHAIAKELTKRIRQE